MSWSLRRDVRNNRDAFHSHRNTPESLAAYNYASKVMRIKMRDKPKLADTLIPTTFPVGCKRPTPGNGYLEALMQDNVHVYQNEGLSQITPKGFVDAAGSEVEVDVIILATGFDTSVRSDHSLQSKAILILSVGTQIPNTRQWRQSTGHLPQASRGLSRSSSA